MLWCWPATLLLPCATGTLPGWAPKQRPTGVRGDESPTLYPELISRSANQLALFRADGLRPVFPQPHAAGWQPIRRSQRAAGPVRGGRTGEISRPAQHGAAPGATKPSASHDCCQGSRADHAQEPTCSLPSSLDTGTPRASTDSATGQRALARISPQFPLDPTPLPSRPGLRRQRGRGSRGDLWLREHADSLCVSSGSGLNSNLRLCMAQMG